MSKFRKWWYGYVVDTIHVVYDYMTVIFTRLVSLSDCDFKYVALHRLLCVSLLVLPYLSIKCLVHILYFTIITWPLRPENVSELASQQCVISVSQSIIYVNRSTVVCII